MINMPSVLAIWLLITELINLDTRGLFAVFSYLLHSFNENNPSSTFLFISYMDRHEAVDRVDIKWLLVD